MVVAELCPLFACHNQLVPCLLGCCRCSPASPCPASPVRGSPSRQRSARRPAWARRGDVALAGTGPVLGTGHRVCRAGNAILGLGKPNPCRDRPCSRHQALPSPDGHGLPRPTGTAQQARGCLEERSNPHALLEVGVWHQPLTQHSVGSWGRRQTQLVLAAPRPSCVGQGEARGLVSPSLENFDRS